MGEVGLGVVARRFGIYLVNLDPTIGSEILKTRPCVVISPDEMNDSVRTVIVAPMTTKGTSNPMRLPCVFGGKRGLIVLDQIRAVDQVRVVKYLGALKAPQAEALIKLLQEMFAD
jgi:mRNA interferase MazF